MEVFPSVDEQIAIRRTITQKLLQIEMLEAQIEIEQKKMDDYCRKITAYEKQSAKELPVQKKKRQAKRQANYKTTINDAVSAHVLTLSFSRLQEPPIPTTLLPLLQHNDVEKINKSLKQMCT